MDRMNLKLDIDGLVDMHIDYLKDTYPELDEKREDVKAAMVRSVNLICGIDTSMPRRI